MNDSALAVKYLQSGDYSCVLLSNVEVYASKERGVKPLLGFLESGKSFVGFSAADRVVGKGAALLYVLLGVNSVWAQTMSEKAKAVLEKSGIEARYEELVPAILNRTGTGLCPVERAVWDLSSPSEAPDVIRQTLESLTKSV